jgi:hypothetical protein
VHFVLATIQKFVFWYSRDWMRRKATVVIGADKLMQEAQLLFITRARQATATWRSNLALRAFQALFVSPQTGFVCPSQCD